MFGSVCGQLMERASSKLNQIGAVRQTELVSDCLGSFKMLKQLFLQLLATIWIDRVCHHAKVTLSSA